MIEDLKKPEFESERDACGISALVDLNQNATKDIVNTTLNALCDLDLRGGKLEDTGDGAGMMLRSNALRKFLEPHLPNGKNIPENEEIFVGNVFVDKTDAANIPALISRMNELMQKEGIHTASWRKLNVDKDALGNRARDRMPIPLQLLFAKGFNTAEKLPLALYRAKLAVSAAMSSVDVLSLEPSVVTYKAMSTGKQLANFYKDDFAHPDFITEAALSHTRFATNVLSRFALAQPFSLLCHNGEINTIAALRASTRDLELSLRLRDSVLMRGGSDSGDLDRMIQLFHSNGVPLSESLRRFFRQVDFGTMSKNDKTYSKAIRRALGPLSAAEGPAAIIAMDDKEIVAILDGLGLRPLRAIETSDNILILTSEIGAPFIDPKKIRKTFQLDAGQMLIVKNGKIYYPKEANELVMNGSALNYQELGSGQGVRIKRNQDSKINVLSQGDLIKKWNLFGADKNLLDLVSAMAREGKEPVLGMGNAQPLAVFSKGNPRLAKYFHQIVAVVTNPPMDPIREGAAMDLKTYIGKRPRANEHGHKYKVQPFLELESPMLSEEDFQSLLNSELPVKVFESSCQGKTEEDLRAKIEEIKEEAVKLVRNKLASVIVLSDRNIKDGEIYIPPVLIAGAIHNELSKFGLRRHASIISDTGEAFETHDIAMLLAMGADAVNPYLLWESVAGGLLENSENLMKTHVATLKRIMSKMGITSIEGYRGSKLMEAVGIDPMLIQFFVGSPVSQIGGLSLGDIVDDIKNRSVPNEKIRRSPDKGAYDAQIRKLLEAIYWSKPSDPVAAFELFAKAVEKQDPVYLRDLLQIQSGGEAINLDEVISEEDLFKNHIRGSAMSHGALQLYAHRAISGAFNDLGGMANSGEGGELSERNKGGIWEKDRSKIRQRASAMFGFDAEYVMNAEEIEIKVGQGAKPGEGGHLPGYKVDPMIARMRKTEVGIDLISPPPLHDVYSIEDLARLIQDLRAVNPKARIAVKVTANTDIGTVAVGVAKAGADVISVSGYEGGTGAASSSSIEHTGLPLELSLSEIHQALSRNGIRDLVKIRADGGIKTAEDIIKLASLGSDEFGLGTVLLVAGERCIFCSSCSGQAHGVKPGTFKECPTGITSITPTGAGKLGLGAAKAKSEDLINEEKSYEVCKEATKHYLKLLAQSVRQKLSSIGKKSINEIVGDTSIVKQISRGEEADRLSLSQQLRDVRSEAFLGASVGTKIDRVLTKPAINEANALLINEVEKQKDEEEITVSTFLNTKDRSFGATLAGKIASGEIKVPNGGIRINTKGFAGQSLGFCNVKGVTIDHEGFANDFVAYAQSGGRTIVRQPVDVYKTANSVVGNACAYGASGGELFASGKAGQRFGVRNCGATLVSEGTGLFPYEYMTGGLAIDLDKVGHQTGSGMSAGKLFLRDEDGSLHERLHSDVKIAPFTNTDRKLLKSVLEDYCNATESPLARKILANLDKEFENFKRVLPKDFHVNLLAKILSYDFYKADDSAPLEDLLAQAEEELGIDRAEFLTLKNTFEESPEMNLEKPFRYQKAKEEAAAFINQAR